MIAKQIRMATVVAMALITATAHGQNQGQRADPFAHAEVVGPMVGQVTPNSAHIWLWAGPGEKAVVSYRPEGVEEKLVAIGAADPEQHDAIKIELPGLRPDTVYEYAVECRGERGPRLSGRFTTAPPVGAPTRFKLALTSCMKFGQPQSSWYLLLAEAPELHLTLGDTTYADTTNREMMWKHHLRYRSLWEPAAVLRHMATYAMWDDHDYGPNDSDGTARGKENSLVAWKELWANPGAGTDDTAGAFFTFSWGDVDFFVLDGRYHRSPDKAPDDENKTMLGDGQFDWLIKRLKASKAKFKVLASGSTWMESQKDGWRIYTHARNELLDAIKVNRINGVLYLSGDVHRSLIRVHEEGGRMGYPLVEVISSGIANSKTLSFATLEFDTTAADPTVRARIIHGDATVRDDRTWKRSELQVQ